MQERPIRYELDPDDGRTPLRAALCGALNALPHYFTSKIYIEGLAATDLFSMNTLLGGAIEEQTVAVLNSLRTTWDPQGTWYDRSFVRFPESFPDVRLVRDPNDPAPVIGIELKGWYLLSKEQEPSFRYKASADAVAPWDLIVCYPWALSNVLSGHPVLYKPYIEQAKYAADMRTYYWHHRKGTSASRSNEIFHPDTQPYPRAGTRYTDSPKSDSGKNFGRIARIPGLMKDWIGEAMDIKLSGIEAHHWIAFFSAFAEANTRDDVEATIFKLVETIRSTMFDEDPDGAIEQLMKQIHEATDQGAHLDP